MLTQKELKRLFTYNPVTGVFTYNIGNKRKKKGDVLGSNSNGYLMCQIKGKGYKLHRLAWLYVNGVFPSQCIDHINHDKKDNRIDNLRDVSHKENLRNTKLRKGSVCHGVTYDKVLDVWNVQIDSVYDSSFECYPDAVNRRKQLEKDNGYHKNHGNGQGYNHYDEVMEMYRQRGMK